ncbi:hypothetical protein IW261DRAFT_391549 [Armillaria novae-zelandiae]|uniref:Uncharacterized protein n=1 Tax=Armillaria novae-zelandiae TaxID=153914 RepID=A0AA39PS63_9AGAR|nr:hypothetical protein IW261DRAFT_391549 [Armillaria novae-zelandiae]
MDLSRPWAPLDIEAIVAAVEQSCLADMDAYLAVSPKTPLLQHRSCQHAGDLLQKRVLCSFRAYLNVPIPAHRKAVVQLLSSSHTLAVEVLRWSERRQPPLPRSQRLCRYCQTEVEDEVHALWCCRALSKLHNLRRSFFVDVFALAPAAFLSDLHSAPSALHVTRLFVDTEELAVLCRFAKFVFDILRVYKEVPVLRS